MSENHQFRKVKDGLWEFKKVSSSESCRTFMMVGALIKKNYPSAAVAVVKDGRSGKHMFGSIYCLRIRFPSYAAEAEFILRESIK